MKQTHFFETLTADWSLGCMIRPPQPVSGGFMHKMFRLDTSTGSYAVKLLNPEIMKRESAMENYRRAEALEAVLEANGLPVVAAMTRNGAKMQCIQDQYYYLFPWVDSRALPWNGIAEEHCAVIGGLLARIHTLEAPDAQAGTPEPFAFAWEILVQTAKERCPALWEELCAALPLLDRAQVSYNTALKALPPRYSICNGDMDCKNVLWQEAKPLVIDLECLEVGNPVNDLVVLALSWSGGAVCALDMGRLSAFVKAYHAVRPVMSLDWQALSGLGFSWLDWLHYNVRRACGMEGSDHAQQHMGITQTRQTLERIRYYADVRERVAALLAESFSPEM